jgi:SAM-dependent methyltransferase
MQWHERFVQQASWTRLLRTYLFERAGMGTARQVLEVGCGTGAILSDLDTHATIHGLDLESDRLVEARLHAPQAILTRADALSLPYASGVFDITFCHFLLLWVRDPLQVLCEMKRITRSGGSILALAEPDYNSRVDKPEALTELGRWQTESLRRQGADAGLGRQLAGLFQQAGIPITETGLLRADGEHPIAPGEIELEWAVLEADLTGRIPAKKLQRMRALDRTAWERRERVLYVPTYWAFGMNLAPGE